MSNPKEYQKRFIRQEQGSSYCYCSGCWDIDHINAIKNELKHIDYRSSELIIDIKGISKLDSAGVWLIQHTLLKLGKAKLLNVSPQHQQLLDLVTKQTAIPSSIPPPKTLTHLEQIGKSFLEQLAELNAFFNFIGCLSSEMLHAIRHPSSWRWSSTINVINTTGLQALPIIGLLSFMIGVVISYQMGNQLRNYGANIFIVNLLGLSILREFGPLLTAIMIAGRTGSAFTAQLGIMKINQEIDALNTMGTPPAELLLLPRIIGLVIVIPLLTMWSNIFGILGGMAMANNMLGVSSHDFLVRFQQAIPVRALIIGLCKAPVFGLIIASIGCFEGMQVKGSAESVGLRTTRSVVLAIFFIIVTDAIFSILFSRFKL
ncbi:MAG TPA: ABC transporter permease [Gammaproteobacteria bacterium]|nr:ABC transporter permease [Gammaproteobacteria bacterium]